MACVVGIIFLISTSATSVIEVLSDPSRDLGIPGQDFLPELGLALSLANVALRALPWGLDLILFLLLYRYVPNCETYWRYIWPGALVAAVLFEVAKGLFIWYLDNLASYRQVYGPLTSVMILLLWTYLSSLILILGAEISSEYGRMRRGLERGTLINCTPAPYWKPSANRPSGKAVIKRLEKRLGSIHTSPSAAGRSLEALNFYWFPRLKTSS